MNKTKLIIFTDWFLPGYKAGGPITSIANLVANIHHDFDIYIVCSNRDYLDSSAYPNISSNQWLSKYGCQIIYLSPRNQNKTLYAGLIDQVKPDVCYINGVFSKSFSIIPLLVLRKRSLRRIIAPRGMFAPSALKIKPLKKKVFLSVSKNLGLYKGAEFHLTSEKEKTDTLNQIGLAKTFIIPNLPSLGSTAKEIKAKKKGELQIITVARIAPEKNIHFIFQTLSKVDQEIKIKLKLVGATYDESYLNNCREDMRKLTANVQVEFCGALHPTEIKKLYKESHLFFLPTLGENYGHAIIESLMNGVPVLISDQTPWKDLETGGLGAEYSLESNAQFVDYISEIASLSQDEYHERAKGISKNILKRLDYQANLESYKRMFNGES